MRVARFAPMLLAMASGCGGAGPYGHAPRYVPTAPEERALSGARELDAATLARRKPDEWRHDSVSLFGVVQSRAAGPAGQALLELGVRQLEPSNACKRSGDDDSCRVTVGDRDFGVVWVLAALDADDDIGPRAIGQRSLVRVVGAIAQDVSPIDGAPVVHAAWYRQWPSDEYVTRAAGR